MPGFFTDALNNRVLDAVLGRQPLGVPETLWLGLSKEAARKSGLVTEPQSGSGYERVAIPNTLSFFPPASAGSKANADTVVFPQPLASWGFIQSVFIADSPTGGTVLAAADLAGEKLITEHSVPPQIAPAALYFAHS